MWRCGGIVAGGLFGWLGWAGKQTAQGQTPAQKLYACQVACAKVVGLVARNKCIQSCLTVPPTLLAIADDVIE